MNMMNMIGIALIQPLIGFILDNMWQGSLEHHIRLYPLFAYQVALIILPLGIFMSLCLLPAIKETHCHPLDDTI